MSLVFLDGNGPSVERQIDERGFERGPWRQRQKRHRSQVVMVAEEQTPRVQEPGVCTVVSFNRATHYTTRGVRQTEFLDGIRNMTSSNNGRQSRNRLA
jgi:hypothetical protein